MEDYLSTQSLGVYLDKLTEKGDRNYFCPFHTERTPSLSYNEEMNVAKCFSCGRGGGLSKFIFYVYEISNPGAHYFEAMDDYLRNNPDVCAELGFQSISDDSYSRKKMSRADTLDIVNSLSRENNVKEMPRVVARAGSLSVDKIMKLVYLRQKQV